MCRRILDRKRIEGYKRNLHELTEAEEVTEEDIMLELEQMGIEETSENLEQGEGRSTQSIQITEGFQGKEMARKRVRNMVE